MQLSTRMSLQTMPGMNWTGGFSWKAKLFTDHIDSRQKWKDTWKSESAELCEFNKVTIQTQIIACNSYEKSYLETFC